MISRGLRPLRDLISQCGEELTFADLSEPLLEDLALGYCDGQPLAIAAARLLSRIDGIPEERRERQISGRALLTLLARQGAGVHMAAAADQVRLLGRPGYDQGDPEAERAWEKREEQYRSLSELPAPYTPEDFKVDAASAFSAARSGVHGEVKLPPDEVAHHHGLALLCRNLPDGLRAWFHRRHPDERADALAWKFVLAGRALARYRRMEGTTPREEKGIPRALLSAVLAVDLGDLARTSILEQF